VPLQVLIREYHGGITAGSHWKYYFLGHRAIVHDQAFMVTLREDCLLSNSSMVWTFKIHLWFIFGHMLAFNIMGCFSDFNSYSIAYCLAKRESA